MATVAEYLENVTPNQKKEYERIRGIVMKIVPEAEEVISYGIPTFMYKGKYLIYFGAFKDHMSVFPGSKIDGMKDKLKGYKLGRGTIQYTSDNLLKEEIIREFVQARYDDLRPKS